MVCCQFCDASCRCWCSCLVFCCSTAKEPHIEEVYPEKDPLLALSPTPSMKATLKYFWVVTALIVVQVGLGAITAHYAVEGSGFYGIPIQEWIPYSVVRTWHTQLGILWIATAWLATGLFMAPAVSGYEPKFQRGLVNFLFVCLLIIVVGSMVGQWMGVFQKFDNQTNFWFGHQGYEYVDLGRFWQIFLNSWSFPLVILSGQSLIPALKKSTGRSPSVNHVFNCSNRHSVILCTWINVGTTNSFSHG